MRIILLLIPALFLYSCNPDPVNDDSTFFVLERTFMSLPYAEPTADGKLMMNQNDLHLKINFKIFLDALHSTEADRVKPAICNPEQLLYNYMIIANGSRGQSFDLKSYLNCSEFEEQWNRNFSWYTNEPNYSPTSDTISFDLPAYRGFILPADTYTFIYIGYHHDSQFFKDTITNVLIVE